MPRLRRLALSAIPILVTTALAGCGGGDDAGGGLKKDALEADISQRLGEATGGSAPDVACPSDLPAENGATIRCRVAVEGTSYGVTVTVTGTTGDSAQYDLQVDEQ